MSTSYRQLLYHIVFRTKDSECTLPLEHKEQLYQYIWGIIKNCDSHLYRINGMSEHVHILTDLHPTVSLSAFLQKLKTSSSKWLKENVCFPNFRGWAEGYAAFSLAWRNKDTVLNYIIHQQVHHQKISFAEEYHTLIRDAGIQIDERFFP
ncbi:MAG: IS200/IS605 family transposase [Proteobacteria bacterium]|nr:IS200/IS605 family transposase [Pseudomonadota bacterium]